MSNSKKIILLQVSGSIAAFKAVALTSLLTKNGYQVEVVLSEGASHFVGAASFEGLTGRKVHQGTFDEGALMAHIELERAADLILLYPASANSLATLANGLGQSLIGCLFLAHEFKKPYLIAPAMNQAMWNHPATEANAKRLTSWGITLLNPTQGTLACGEVGAGRLVEPEAMLLEIEKHLSDRSMNAVMPSEPLPRILVTAGGTTEPIDEVRHLTNFSTGRTGYQLALALQDKGYPVTLMQSEYSSAYNGIENLCRYSTTKDFGQKIKTLLTEQHYDYVIHAAAVADYHVDTVSNGNGDVLTRTTKIQSDLPLFLKLSPNPKIIRELRTWSKNKALKIISFKLTSGEGSEMKLESYDSEWIIHNDLRDVGEEKHQGRIFKRSQSGSYEPSFAFATKTELKDLLLKIIQNEGTHL